MSKAKKMKRIMGGRTCSICGKKYIKIINIKEGSVWATIWVHRKIPFVRGKFVDLEGCVNMREFN